jgi:hypothetical protein
MLSLRPKPVIVEAVQWTGDDQAWAVICALHADSEAVAFHEDDGTVTSPSPLPVNRHSLESIVQYNGMNPTRGSA